jgi:tripartite-type tricarboxylate transporter receptor subunit TctC
VRCNEGALKRRCVDHAEGFFEKEHAEMNWPRVLAIAVLLVSGSALAQSYPVKPIRVVSPNSPGGSGDIVTRAIGVKLTEAWGQQVLIDNRPGGNGIIGTEHAARSAADGYTILLGADILFSINPHIYKKLPYQLDKDFDPVIQLTFNEFFLFVHATIPANNLADLVVYLKANPGKHSYSSSGVGSIHHLSMELLKSAAGFNAVHVPYKGFGQAVPDIVSGVVQMGFATPSVIMPLVKAGKLKALAVGAARRLDTSPDIPTLAETYPGVETNASWNFFAPIGSPRPVLIKLNAEINRILALPDVRERLASQGLFPIGGPAESLMARMKSDYEKWGAVIRRIDLKAE